MMTTNLLIYSCFGRMYQISKRGNGEVIAGKSVQIRSRKNPNLIVFCAQKYMRKKNNNPQIGKYH